MKKLFLFAGLLSALVFTSCKKNKDNNPDNGSGVTKYIKKMTQVEEGKTTVYNFTYDANKRLQSYTSTDNSEWVKFTYDNNGNVTKVEQLDDDFKNIYTYAYTNNSPVSATFKSYKITGGEPDDLIEDDELTYTVTNGQVSKMVLYMKQFDETLDMDLTYNNGNLAKVQTKAGSSYSYTANFTFGNKKSPFPQLSKYVLDQAGFSILFASKNEMLTAKFDFSGTQFDNEITMTYTYDKDGYPTTSNDGETKTTYEYQ